MDLSNTKRILVIGATGGVGRHICNEVIRLFERSSLIIGDYKPARGLKFAKSLGKVMISHCVDAANKESIEQAVEDVDAVIVAAQQKEPLVQSVCLAHQIPCLDITVQPEFVAKVNELHSQAKSQQTLLIVMAGFSPGLSGIMAKHAAETFTHVFSINVGLLQNTQASAGATGIADMLGLFAQPVMFNKDGKQQMVPGYTVKKEMVYPDPFGRKNQRLVNFIEASVVSEKFKVHDVNYWTSFDKSSFDLLVSFLKKLGLLKLFNVKSTRMGLAKIINFLKGISKPKSETTAIIVEVYGQKNNNHCTTQISIVAPSDYGTTAMSVVAMAKLVIQKRVKVKGVRFPFEVFPMDMLIDTIDYDDLKVYS